MTQALPNLPLGRVDGANGGMSTARTLQALHSPGQGAALTSLTPKAPGERRPRAGSYLGKGTVGLGPDCNTLLKKCDRDAQKRWLQSRTADISRYKAEREKQHEIVVPKDRYTHQRNEADRMRTMTEEAMEKVRMKNANLKKEAKEQHDRLRREEQSHKQDRVREVSQRQKNTLQPVWQWQNARRVWCDFATPDSAMLEETHEAFTDQGKPLEVTQLCHTEGPTSFEFDRNMMRDASGQEFPIRRKLIMCSVQRGFLRGDGTTDALEGFRNLCDGLTLQMRNELDTAVQCKASRTQEERDRKRRIREQQGDNVRTAEVRRRMQQDKQKLQKKHKMLKDKGLMHRENQRAEIQEERKNIMTRKQERQEHQERILEQQYKELKARQQEDASRREANRQESLSEKKRAILNIKEQSVFTGPTSAGTVALSKGQARVRQNRLDNVSEITSMKEWIRNTREYDNEQETQWKQYLLSTVKSRSPTSMTSRSPLSPASQIESPVV